MNVRSPIDGCTYQTASVMRDFVAFEHRKYTLEIGLQFRESGLICSNERFPSRSEDVAFTPADRQTTVGGTPAGNGAAAPIGERLTLTQTYFFLRRLRQRFGGDHQRTDRDHSPFVADERIRVTFGGANHGFRGAGTLLVVAVIHRMSSSGVDSKTRTPRRRTVSPRPRPSASRVGLMAAL